MEWAMRGCTVVFNNNLEHNVGEVADLCQVVARNSLRMSQYQCGKLLPICRVLLFFARIAGTKCFGLRLAWCFVLTCWNVALLLVSDMVIIWLFATTEAVLCLSKITPTFHCEVKYLKSVVNKLSLTSKSMQLTLSEITKLQLCNSNIFNVLWWKQSGKKSENNPYHLNYSTSEQNESWIKGQPCKSFIGHNTITLTSFWQAIGRAEIELSDNLCSCPLFPSISPCFTTVGEKWRL